METITYRGTRLSRLGIGCYGVSGAYGKPDLERFTGVLRRAYDLGVTLFDTADVYGPGEEVLGRAVAPFRDQVCIATKVGAGPDGKPNCSQPHVLASCDRSLQRLKTDWIDLYQVHVNDPHTPVAETVAALEILKARGKIRHYGVGHLPPSRLVEYLAAGDIFSMLVELNATTRETLTTSLPLCHQHNVGAIAFSITARGLLTGKIGPHPRFEPGDIRRIDPLFQRERLASGLRVAERFRQLGRRLDKTAVQVAIAWVLAQPGVICALTGPSNTAHLEENVGGSGWKIPPGELADLTRFLTAEDGRLQRGQMMELEAILKAESVPEQLFADLIYVLETLVTLGLAQEEQILPLFQRLWALRDQPEPESLTQIRAELRAAYLPLLTTLPETGSELDGFL